MGTREEIKRLLKRKWHTIPALQTKISRYSMSTAVSARIRDLRKSKFGGHNVVGRPKKGFKGLWEYRIEI